MKVSPQKLENGLILYVGYPILTGGLSLWDYGLTIADLPQHDAVVEFLFIMEGMKRSMIESEQYLNEISQMNNRLDELVKERTLQLERANDELESFVRTVSHDLRSPLRLINSFASIILNEDLNLPENINEMLIHIKKCSENMNSIMTDLINLSRINHSTPKKEYIDLQKIVYEVLNEIQSIGDYKSNNTSVKIIDLGGMTGDAGLIKLLFQNLIHNAFKYSSKVEYPAVEIGMIPSEKDELIYFVKDNGSGFDSDNAPQLFQPFQRLHTQSEFEGSGIGLSIVYSIVKKHKGHVWAKSQINEGATFFISFPNHLTVIA